MNKEPRQRRARTQAISYAPAPRYADNSSRARAQTFVERGKKKIRPNQLFRRERSALTKPRTLLERRTRKKLKKSGKSQLVERRGLWRDSRCEWSVLIEHRQRQVPRVSFQSFSSLVSHAFPEVVETLEPSSKKRRISKKDEQKRESWKKMTKTQLNELDQWIETNSMKENSCNLTVADMTIHVTTTYDVKASVCFFGVCWL